VEGRSLPYHDLFKLINKKFGIILALDEKCQLGLHATINDNRWMKKMN
jgi:hypothetical protein